jgi:thioredoxin 1
MNTISTNINWAIDQVKDTVAPLTIKVAAGSLLTWSSPKEVALAFAAKECFQQLGYVGISQLCRKFELTSDHAIPLLLANTAISVFGAKKAVQRLGFDSSYLAMGLGMMANIGFNIYQAVQFSKEDPFQEDSKVVTVTMKNFQEEVENSKLPVVLDAYATWCPPCKMIAPVIEKIAETCEGKVKFAKMNVDNEPELSEKVNLAALPTFIFFKDGKEIQRYEGIPDMHSFLEDILALQDSK